MDPYQFLLLADWLIREQGHAAGFRSAISRAYYAAHHVARRLIEDAEVYVKRTGEAHTAVWMHLAETGDAEVEQVSSLLALLHSSRLRADYELNSRDAENHQSAAAMTALSRWIIEAIAKCRADVARFESLMKAIRHRNAILRGASPSAS